MVHHLRHNNQWKKVEAIGDEDEESQATLVMDCSNYKRTRPKFLSLLVLSLLSCTFVVATHVFGSTSVFSLLYSDESEGLSSDTNSKSLPCSSVSDGTICCDRSSMRTDVCVMKGDVRTHSPSSSIILYGSGDRRSLAGELQHEKVKPYTRKWETSVMDTIDELDLIARVDPAGPAHGCDVRHDVPAVFFSTGGYTGNVYHEFNDGILPLYITSRRFKKRVVFVILEYHNWWVTKYGDVLSRLSDRPPVDFRGDPRTHCFSEAVVGLGIHGELSVDPALMDGNKSVLDFRRVLDRAYWPRIKGLIRDEKRQKLTSGFSPDSSLGFSPDSSLGFSPESRKPSLVILSRNGSRAITNENDLVKLARELGFRVRVLRPDKTTELAKIYRALNSSDVMIGVHGAAMTHFLFMRPGTSFIQVVPLGTDWAAETYYGEPARKLGLNYVGYKISISESSLYDKYDKNDVVLRDPDIVNKKGWQFTKSIYLDGQNVRLDLKRFKKHLVDTYNFSLSKIENSY